MALAATGGDPETLFAGSAGSGVARSDDGGQTWSFVNPPGVRGAMALAVDRSDPGVAYAGVEGGIYKTTDAGNSWSKLPFPADNAVTIAVSPAQPGAVLAIAVKNRQGQVFRSDDGGLTWGGSR